MKTNIKLIRLVLASAVGSVLWAGCSGPRMAQNAYIYPDRIASAPVDQTYRRPDTHPEWRSGLWQYGVGPERTGQAFQVVETTVATSPDQIGADSTHLLVFNQEVLNVAATPVVQVATTGPDGVIIEAAGAERSDRVQRIVPAQISPAASRWAGGVITTETAPAAP